jgi:hypothetical protein
LPAYVVKPVGAPGTPAGVTLFEAAEAAPEPELLVALTVKVYAAPLVNPLTVIDVHGAVHVPVILLGLLVAV